MNPTGAHLAELSLPTIGYLGSKPAIINFYKEYFQLFVKTIIKNMSLEWVKK